MSTVATIWVKLGLDSTAYKSGLAGADSATASAAQNMSSKLTGIGTSMMKTGAIATAGLTVPIVAGLGKAVMAASDLEESINAINVVFGDAAAPIIAFGETSATSVGLSQSAFQEMATITGALLQNLGFDADTAAQSTIDLTSRAADMASVFNTDVDQALLAVNSALKGEFNPLEQFGVKLNQADINARAMAMGLADAEGNLDNNARAQAALAIIMEQTDKISGDFQNTSDGLANSQRILSAQFGDVAAQIGNLLLPFVTQLVQWISNLVTWFGNLSPATQGIIVVILILVAAIGPLLLIFGALITAIGAIIPILVTVAGVITGPILVAIAAVIAIVALFAAAWANNWGGIRDIIMNVWNNNIKPAFAQIVAFLQVAIPAAIAVVVKFWEGVLLPALMKVWDFIKKNIIPLFLALAGLLGAVVGKAVEALAGLWQNVLQPALEVVWSFIKTKLLPVIVNFLGPKLQWLADKVLPALKGAFDGIVKVIKIVVDWIKELADKIANLELPDWLTPGSPTPFELGLKGIASAMSKLTKQQLPSFEAGLDIGAPGTANIPAPMGAGGESPEMLAALNVLGDRIEDLTVRTVDTIAQTS